MPWQIVDTVLNGINTGIGAAQLGADIYFGNKNLKIAEDQYELASKGYTLDRQNTYLSVLQQQQEYKKGITELKGQQRQIDIDIRDTNQQITSFDSWLANYQDQYDQETTTKAAQTAALEEAGLQQYNTLMDNIGMRDAMAGASGRVGGNTSQGAMTTKADNDLTRYVGEDRTLDMNGGLYGLQRTAAELEMGQLKYDLGAQLAEVTGNRANAAESLTDLAEAKDLIGGSIKESEEEITKLKGFIENNFGDIDITQRTPYDTKTYGPYTG